jgi:hypothetical protein
MKRSIARSPLIETPNKWIQTAEGIDQWEYGDYKCCLLSVRKTKDGKYRPCVNGCNNLHLENWVFNDPRPVHFDTLKEAQNHAFKYMDNLRAREAREFKLKQDELKIYLNAYVQTTSAKM